MEQRRIKEVNANEMIISGYAITYGKESLPLGNKNKFVEIVSPKALDFISFEDVKLLWNHQRNELLARTSSGTLKLENRSEGLWFEAELPDTQLGRDTFELISRNDLKGMSFEMSVNKDTWDTTQNPVKRTIHEIGQITEISVVIDPAYPTTHVSQRSLDTINDIQDCLECQMAQEANNIIKEMKETYE